MIWGLEKDDLSITHSLTMGYYLKAFIGKANVIKGLTNAFSEAKAVEIGQGYTLVPMTDELYDQINQFVSSGSIDNFVLMTGHVEREILLVVNEKQLLYVEADYFGGQGGQVAIIWEDGKRVKLLPFGDDRINQALQYVGVVADNGKDEFLTFGLGLHRYTEDWIDDAT